MGKKNLIIAIICLLVVGASFYAGMSYERGRIISKNGMPDFGSSKMGDQTNLTRRMGQGSGANAINGEILSRDDKSITVKLRDGGSKIVFLVASTTISKSTEGIKDDLEAGKSVVIFGSTNTDGSVNAQSIQLRDGFQERGMPGQEVKR